MKWNAFSFLFVLSISAHAQETMRGEIREIDPKKRLLQVEARNGRFRRQVITIHVPTKTQIEFGILRPEAGQFADLQTGRRARFILIEEKNQLQAISIRVIGRRPVRASKSIAGENVVSGMLQRVALTDREIVVIGPGKDGPETETVLAVPENVKVIVDGKAIPYAKLRDGQTAKIRTFTKQGKRWAQTVLVGEGDLPTSQSQNEGGRFQLLIQMARNALDLAEDWLSNPEKPSPGRP